MADPDPYRELRERLDRSVLEAPGHTEATLRRAAAEGRGLPPPLAAYVDKVRRHAYKITDEEVAGLQRVGYSEDQLFEITVSAALGAAHERLVAALVALEQTDAPAQG